MMSRGAGCPMSDREVVMGSDSKKNFVKFFVSLSFSRLTL